MSILVFGIRIILDDYSSPVSQDASIGLYNISSDLTSDANSGQAEVVVSDANIFREYSRINISDDTPQNQVGIISSIDTGTNTLTLKQDLNFTFTTGNNAKVDSDSQFRWVQNSVSGVSWNYDMLVKGSLGKIIKSVNLNQGGNTATINNITSKINNTNLFWNELDSREISLIGKLKEFVCFIDSTMYVLWSGICEKCSYTKAIYTIPAIHHKNKRNAYMGVDLNSKDFNLTEDDSQIGKMIPGTYGEWKDKYAKFIKSSYSNTTFEMSRSEYLSLDGSVEIDIYNNYGTNYIFPIVTHVGSEEPPYRYGFKVADENTNTVRWRVDHVTVTTGQLNLDYFKNKYMKCVIGDGEGDSRLIVSAHVDLDVDYYTINVELSDYYSTTLTGNTSATVEDNSWIKIQDIEQEYQCDSQPCHSFIDTEGNETSTLDVYIYDSEKKVDVTGEEETVFVQEEQDKSFIKLANYALTVSGSNNNTIDIDTKLFKDSPTNVDSFIITPVNNPTIPEDSGVDFDAKWDLYNMEKYSLGIYIITYYEGALAATGDVESLGNLLDKDSTTKIYIDTTTNYPLVGTTSPQYIWTLEFDLPTFPTDFKIDKVYLGIKYNHTRTSGDDVNHFKFYYKWKRFIGSITTEIEKDWEDGEIASEVVIDDLPDFYFTTDNPSTKNKNFFVQQDIVDDGTDRILSGYQLFELNNFNKQDVYNSIRHNLIYFFYENGDSLLQSNLFEVCIIYKKSNNIGSEIYSPVKGRVFNDTWEGRKTSTDLIENPIDLYEEAIRKSNMSEIGIMPSAGWGLEYSDSALVKIDGDGSLDSSYFDERKTFKCSRQILNKADFYTEKIKQTLCRNFWLIGYTNENGYECLEPFDKTVGTPTASVSLSDIRRTGKIITINEPDPNFIYPEPFVRYNYNNGSKKYDGYLGVTNVTADNPTDEEKAGFVLGNVDGSTAVYIYDECVKLYNKTGIITPPPTFLSDLQYANGNLTNADEIAVWYLLRWITIMGLKSVIFPLHFFHSSNGINTWQWNVGQRFNLQLPHETNDQVTQALAVRHEITTSPPYHLNIKALIIEEGDEEYFIQEVMQEATKYIFSLAGDYLGIFNINTPANISYVGKLNLGTSGSDLYVTGNYCYIIESGYLYKVDISSPANPTLELTMEDGDGGVILSGARRVTGYGNHLYITGNGSVGFDPGYLQILDISTSTPTVKGTYTGSQNDFLHDSYDLDVIDVSSVIYLIVAGHNNSGSFSAHVGYVSKWNVTDPDSPSYSSRWTGIHFYDGFKASKIKAGRIAAIDSGQEYTYLFNVGTGSGISSLGNIRYQPNNGIAIGLSDSGEYLFGIADEVLHSNDFTGTPTNIDIVNDGDEGGLIELDNPSDIECDEDYVYVAATNDDTVWIGNISDPTNVVHEGKITHGGDVYLDGVSRLYIASVVTSTYGVIQETMDINDTQIQEV